ncbi:DNA polymerase delta subunit 4 [Colletotrichum spaethianum]|uniref:DNA polymerase delta subunit 4 n=1 Tax=Colletotrichum spaethianum TaxID=700344 RepID=A0AA37P136_9PEZI|nr:DNA polymerase delta subunit 4 [Colletotrichum spaethianum]GKT44408.1 DNA polymerase delta subunit 4 [Colletotrichum spaethianum]
MPTTRRSAGGARARPGPTRGQSTISFSHRVSKPVPKEQKKAALTSAVERAEIGKPAKDEEEANEIQLDEPASPEIEEPDVKEEVPEKSESVTRAEKISDAQINKYWKSVEAQRIAPRVHQKDPCIGLQRMKRWQRAERLGLNPPIEVLAVLLREQKKGASLERAHMDELMNSTAVGTA